MANDLDDLDEAEGGPQPAEGSELVIIDLRHPTIMPPAWPDDRAAALAVPSKNATTPGRGLPGSPPRPSCTATYDIVRPRPNQLDQLRAELERMIPWRGQ